MLIFENEETKITLSENKKFIVNGVEVVTLVLVKKIEDGFNYAFFEFNSKHSIPEQPFTWQELEVLEEKLDYKTKFHLGIIVLKNWIKFYLRNGYKVKMRG